MFFPKTNRITTVQEINKLWENLKMPGKKKKNTLEKSNIPGKVKLSKI